MSRHATLASFLVTVAVAVPAGWHALGANIETDGKRLRPMEQTFTADGVRVTLDVDRSIVMTGDTVKAKLVAFSDTPRTVKVDVHALHSSNYEGERVEMPWEQFDKETLTLHAAPDGGAPVETAIKLGERPKGPALTDSFRIYVTAHGTKLPTQESEVGPQSDYTAGISEGTAAAINIRGWSGNNLKLAIEPEGPITGDAPFTVAVRVKNTSGKQLAYAPYVHLSTEEALSGIYDSDTYETKDAALTIEEIDKDDGGGDDEADRTWKRGASEVKKYRVTPTKKLTGKITFLAEAFVSDDAPGPTTAGAIDAKTFDITESTPSVAEK